MSILPKDLFAAEDAALNSLLSCLKDESHRRIEINLKFEGLRIMPVALRLAKQLESNSIKINLFWPDAGATALAQRDQPELKDQIFSFSESSKDGFVIDNDVIVIAVAPSAFDYEEFSNLCNSLSNKIIVINPKLEDLAVGIGSVARQRRKTFLSQWFNVYWLEPIQNGALKHQYPEKWSLFKLYENGYKLIQSFDRKPDSDLIFNSMLM